MGKKLKLGFISSLALLLVVLTGCQAVGGVDLNKVLIDNMTLTSYEGSSEFEIEVLTKEDAALTEEAALIQIFNDFSVVVHNVKMQDITTMSMEGKAQLLGEEIAFTLTMDENEMAVLIDGASKPIVIPQTYDDEMMPAEFAELQQLFTGRAFTEDMVKLVTDIGGFFIKHFPNPASVTVENVNENIQGENVQLKKVEIELKGSELLGMVKTFLEGLLEDEEGLNETLSELYDVFAPIITQVLEVVSAEADDDSLIEILPFLENKQLAVGFLYTAIQSNLAPIVENFESNVEAWIGEETAAMIFNDNNILTTALYVDGEGMLRKQDFELTVGLGLGAVDAVQIRSSNVYWNLNGTVEAQLLDTTDALIVNESTTGDDFKQLFEEDSLIYNWINQLEAIFPAPAYTQFVMLDMSGNTVIPGYEQQPYISNNSTMVPVRYVSEELLAQVNWNSETKEVTVTDLISDTSIVLTVDSNIAVVDGETYTLDTAAELQNNSVFVPVRFIAEALGGEVIWDEATKTVIIAR